MLLKDSEGPDSGRLCDALAISRDLEDRVFWMVQVMESWFLADVAALQVYYGQGFQETALPKNPKVEEVFKADVLSGLKNATRNTPKGRHHKTGHAPEILRGIDPQKVRTAAPHCERMFATLLRLAEQAQREL